jgi:hypothetical protein
MAGVDPTLAGVLDDLARRGFTAHFGAVGDRLQVLDDGRVLPADELTIREYHRFEGVSDPDDMAIVYALESRDGTRGTLVDAFGAYSNPAVGAVLDAIPTHARAHPGAPPSVR